MSKSDKKNVNSNKPLIIVSIAIFLVTIMLSVSLFTYFYITNYGENPKIDTVSQNVILIFTDEVTEENASYPILSEIKANGVLKTRSLNLKKSDESAFATATATGVKVYNGRINHLFNKDLENVSDLVANTNKKYGLITLRDGTSEIMAAYTSHNKSIENSSEIAYEQVTNTKFDLFISIGQSNYNEYSSLIETENRSYCKSYTEFYASTKPQALVALEDSSSVYLATLCNDLYGRLSNANTNGFVAIIDAIGAKEDELKATLNSTETYLKTINTNTSIMIISRNNFYALGKGSDKLPKELDNTDIFKIVKQLIA